MADLQSVKDDIAFMRALAEEGRSAPLFGGAIMLAAGLVFGAASLGHYAVMSGLVAVGPWVYAPLWFAALAVFLAAKQVLQRRYRGMPGVTSPGNRAVHAAWSGVGFAIFAMAVVLGVAAWRTQDVTPLWLFPSMIISLYGAAWFVAGRLMRERWMVGVAALCFALAGAMAFTLGRPELYLLYAVSLLLCAAAPGWLLMRQEPSDVV